MSALRLDDTSLVRNTYRALLRTNRAYAAFTQEDKALIGHLRDRHFVLDPMAGYGGLTQLAAGASIGSYSVELNEPQYLWQVLTHPSNRQDVRRAIAYLLRNLPADPSPECSVVVCEDFFPPEAMMRLEMLTVSVRHAVGQCGGMSEPDDLVDALVLPFVGRLAALRPSQNPAHVKGKGGLCVVRGWVDDFELYLRVLDDLLGRLKQPAVEMPRNELALGDARTHRFPRNSFDAMLTSPPYPNRADYAAIFAPEIDYLDRRTRSNRKSVLAGRDLIGSVLVSGRGRQPPQTPSAIEFLERADKVALAGGSRTAYDQRQYYRPYFEQYFAGVEMAWRNVSVSLTDDVLGYIAVVNNTHRGIVVPVAEFAVEVWTELGFTASIIDTSERTHVGTMNPRARGLRAVHARHVVEIRGRS